MVRQAPVRTRARIFAAGRPDAEHFAGGEIENQPTGMVHRQADLPRAFSR